MDKEEIEFYSVEYWQENWDELFDRVEQGEVVGIYDEDSGHRAVMVPVGA
jgi:hypothetical protein